jgi:hypothetical protein
MVVSLTAGAVKFSCKIKVFSFTAKEMHMPSIHLIEKNEKYKIVDKDSDEWESGVWAVSIEKASNLIHGNIYLHRGQKEPSFFGGVINGFRITGTAPNEKITFRFRRMLSHEGVTTEKEGWGNEQKRVWS